MDLADFGMTVATIAATGGVEKVGADVVGLASDGVGRVRSRLREWFGGQDDGDVLVGHLEAVEQSPVEMQIKILAMVLDEMAARDAAGASEVASLVEELRPGVFAAGSSFKTVVKGKAKNTTVQNAENITNSNG